jgi:hypothetical protein
MGATDVSFTEILVARFAVGAAGALVKPWLRGQEREQRRQRLAGEPVVIDVGMLAIGCVAFTFALGDLLLIGRWIATGHGPGLRVLVLSL